MNYKIFGHKVKGIEWKQRRISLMNIIIVDD